MKVVFVRKSGLNTHFNEKYTLVLLRDERAFAISS